MVKYRAATGNTRWQTTKGKVVAEKLVFVVIVNGKPTEVEANTNAPLHSIISKALHQTGNAGQSPDNWELRDAAGALLDKNRKISEFAFATGTRLFLNLQAGVGG